MPRIRIFAMIAAWAGLAWIIVNEARTAPVSDNFWISILYVIGLIGAAFFVFVAIFPPLVMRLRAGVAGMIAIAILIFLILGAVEVFWLHDWIAGRI